MNHNSFETSHNVTLTLAVGLIFTFGLNFDYLMVRGNTLESTHKAKYRLKSINLSRRSVSFITNLFMTV